MAQAQTGSAAQNLAAQQQQAESLRDQLLPFFVTEFSQTAGKRTIPYNPRIGTKIKVKVQSVADFNKQFAANVRDQDAADIAALVKYRTGWVESIIRDLQRQGTAVGTYPAKFTPTTQIDPRDAGNIRSSSPRATQNKVAGFYDGPTDTLYILDGNLDNDVIGHELCHAYTHPNWNDVQLHVSAFAHAVEMNRIDEGVTSEMANIVLLKLAVQQAGGVPAPPPNGYVGYPNEVRFQAAKFLQAVDKQSSPGNITIEAYFGGAVDVVINEKKPDDSELVLGFKKKRVKLGSVIWK